MKKLADAIRPTLNDAAGPGWRDALTLLQHWGSIVGPEIARLCTPSQVRFPAKTRNDGTLVLAAPGAARLELQHHSPGILAKVNAFFGYAAITRLQLVPGELPTVMPQAEPQNTPENQPEIDLNQALDNLQKAVQKATARS